ncbi:MAG: serine hydroxymethyltransferase, partial [Desulfobacterales bacterium]
GTDNHLMLIDLTNLTITGREAEDLLGRAGLTANKNTIPNDKRGPAVTSGIRLGTPAITTRGMGPAEMETIARLIHAILTQPEDEGLLAAAGEEVRALCRTFPLYADIYQEMSN